MHVHFFCKREFTKGCIAHLVQKELRYIQYIQDIYIPIDPAALLFLPEITAFEKFTIKRDFNILLFKTLLHLN